MLEWTNASQHKIGFQSLRKAVFVVLFVFVAVSNAYACRRRELLAAVFAEEIAVRHTGKNMLVVVRIVAVANTDAGRRREFLATVLAKAVMLLIRLSCQLVLVIGRIVAVAYADT